jgi:hypothetical protein
VGSLAHYLVFAFALGQLWHSAASAQPLALPEVHPKINEIRKFQRCSALFTGIRLNADHPLTVSILSGEKTGTEACMSLLSMANLDGQDQIPAARLEIGSKVLGNFVIAFRSQLVNPDPSTGMMDNANLFDVNETGYQWAFSLFKPGEQVRNVLTRNFALRAIRLSERQTRTQNILLSNLGGGISFTQGYNSVPWSPALVPVGKLIGLTPDTIENNVANVAAGHYTYFSPLTKVQPVNLKTNLHYGGGMIGSQTYQHGNNSLLFAATGEKTARVWAKNLLKDTLCIDVPSLQSADVVSKVRNDSNFPWMKGVSCQTCHYTMDSLAGVSRNLIRFQTSDSTAATFWYKIPASEAAAPLPETSADALFSKRPAQGRLAFRNYRGELVNLEVNGLAQLGETLAAQDDFYVCTAKKMFRHLTGIEAKIGNLNDLITPVSLNPTEMYFRNLVIAHGLKLKQTQDLKILIGDIIDSPYFLRPDQGVQR